MVQVLHAAHYHTGNTHSSCVKHITTDKESIALRILQKGKVADADANSKRALGDVRCAFAYLGLVTLTSALQPTQEIN